MIVNLTADERLNLQYILPVQGSLETLELVEKIVSKCKINETKDLETIEIDFDETEIEFIQDMINFLDSQKRLSLQALSLIRKILNIKEINHV